MNNYCIPFRTTISLLLWEKISFQFTHLENRCFYITPRSLCLSGSECWGIRRDVCLFFVYSRTSNFSAIWRLSPLPVTRLQILAYARRSGPLSREGSLSCHTYCDTGPRFIRSHSKDRHLRPTVGFEPPTQGSSDHCTRRPNHCGPMQIATGNTVSYPYLIRRQILELANL
jgi:hypothetical protein